MKREGQQKERERVLMTVTLAANTAFSQGGGCG